MDAFNCGYPLRVVRLDDARIGIQDEAKRKVWVEKQICPVRRPEHLPTIDVIPKIPEHYGAWNNKSIGGVSKTVRRIGLLRSISDDETCVVIFATHIPDTDALATLFVASEIATVGDVEMDDECGAIAEIVVHKSRDVTMVAAMIARLGAHVQFENNELNARKCLAIERLDRIDDYGARRGHENWKFSWIPDHWEVPLTWGHLARNMQGIPIADVPEILRPYVAESRLRGDEGELGIEERKHLNRYMIKSTSTRWVSAGLTPAQSRQLIEAFYALSVECHGDSEIKHVASLILFRYMVECGYTARWLGKYRQDAEHLGNGERIRRFKRLDQYDPERLPVHVLNQIVQRTGRLHGRGSKGSRSRYGPLGKRYVPTRRMYRSSVDEHTMRGDN